MATGLNIAKFPDDFCQRPHPVFTELGYEGWQWQLLDAKGKCLVSVVGGQTMNFGGWRAPMVYGDGVDTFEMWDMLHESEPHRWLTKKDINAHLVEKGIVAPKFEDLDIQPIQPKEPT